MIIIGGDKKATDGLHTHQLPNAQTAEGVLHFYKSADGQVVYLNEEQFRQAE